MWCAIPHEANLWSVRELNSSDASSAGVDIQTSDDVDDCSEDIQLKISVQQVGRRVDDEYNVRALSAVYCGLVCHTFEEIYSECTGFERTLKTQLLNIAVNH